MSWRQRSPEARREMQICERMAAARPREPDLDAEDQTSLFFCSWFFPEPNVLYPIFPILGGGGVS